jgi:two-component system, OmpR family, sensor histidine kinase PrrB
VNLRRTPHSVRFRAAVAIAATMGVAVAVMAIGVTLTATRAAVDSVDRDLGLAARLIAPSVTRDIDNRCRGIDGQARAVDSLLGTDSMVRIIDDGTIDCQHGVSVDLDVPGQAGSSTEFIGFRRWRQVTLDAEGGGLVQVATPLSAIRPDVVGIRRAVLGPGLLAIVFSGALGFALSNWATRPIRTLSEATRRLFTNASAPGVALSMPPIASPREAVELRSAIDELRARADAALRRARQAAEVATQFSSDAGHELRTPLTSLGAYLSVLDTDDLSTDERQEILRRAGHEQARLSRLVTQLQSLARADVDALAEQGNELGAIDLTELADQAVDAAMRRHPSARFQMTAPSSGVWVTGSEEGLRCVLENLLENAAIHGRPGPADHDGDGDGELIVDLNISVEKDDARIVLADNGPGIPIEDRHRVTERFQRGPTPGPGSGLGLSIALQQITAHGGTLSIVESSLGGAGVEVRMPIASPP